MNLADVLQAYEDEVRARPIARTGFCVEDDGSVIRLKGPFVFVSQWSFTEATMDAAVASLVEEARKTRALLIWRVFPHDQPATLAACLRRQGFVSESPGTLMVFDLSQTLPSPATSVEVRRAITPQDVDDYLSVMDAVFGDDDTGLLKDTYDALLDDAHFCLFTAYVEGKPVAGGRLESGPGRQFGALFGGGVEVEYRGRGIYRSLVHARAQEARRLGLRYISTEALETSRPILQRMGFEPLASETTWLLPATA